MLVRLSAVAVLASLLAIDGGFAQEVDEDLSSQQQSATEPGEPITGADLLWWCAGVQYEERESWITPIFRGVGSDTQGALEERLGALGGGDFYFCSGHGSWQEANQARLAWLIEERRLRFSVVHLERPRRRRDW